MTSLVERPLMVSPSLAATIGLDAALLYQLLAEWQLLLDAHVKQGQHWHLIELAKLEAQLPFWETEKILDVLRILNDQGLIIVGGVLMSNLQNIRFALPQRGTPAPEVHPTHRQTSTPSRAPEQRQPQAHIGTRRPSQPVPGHTVIPGDWCPDQASIDYLIRFNQVDPSFIESSLPEFIAHYRETGETRASWTSTFSQYVSRRWKKAQYQKIEQARNQPIDDEWQPSLDALEILDRDGITRPFIEDAIPEFILYWRERGTVDNNWNSRFIQHIRLQWARYTRTVSNEQEITPIPSNWQPSEAVFDILHMARIDPEFAQQQIPEFLLFWQDSGQAHRSWNTKFLQHVKYRWAHSHQLGQDHARQQQASGKNPPANSFIEKHTDRSWREGL
jgi:hypothetical protein